MSPRNQENGIVDFGQCVLNCDFQQSVQSEFVYQIPVVRQASGSWEREASRPLGDCEMV